VDLIPELPTTKSGYNAIVVFVDRLTKLIICEPVKAGITAQQLAQVFYRAVFRHHGSPLSLISDRDSKFTSDFWQSWHKCLGTKLNMSTSRHPETDGQTERANQVLEDMIRAYVSAYHDDWDEHLIAAEFAYNDSVNASTGYTPFYLNYGQHPITPLTMLCPPNKDIRSETVRAFAGRLRADLQQARDALQASQLRHAKYANAKRRDYTFRVGDKVWLSAKHLHLTKAENAKQKLQPRFYGPFKVIGVVSPVAYRLELPSTVKIHPVIHISHLKAYSDGSTAFPQRPEYKPPPFPQVIEDEPYFSIEAFRKQRRNRGRLSFLVKWLGYGETENSWLSADRLQEDMTPESYKELLDAYKLHTKAKL
jgi:hypothetical protein